MTLFDGTRLTQATLRLDLEGLRRGVYSDKYFDNVRHVFEGALQTGYVYGGHSPRPMPDAARPDIAHLQVEAQIFNRRQPFALVAGVDAALAMLKGASGYYDDDRFVETWRSLAVEAVHDGALTRYEGDTEDVEPVIRVRGEYRALALLETPILGILTRASRIATNVYEALLVANGKTILFFPARFDLPQVQAVDGYAYWLAVQRYNHDTGRQIAASVSTDAQAQWWGGEGAGTVPHALIAAFLGDTAEAMIAYARFVPPQVRRIALVDFNNDTVRDSLAVLHAFWTRHLDALQTGDADTARRFTLDGVRLDTAANLRDHALAPDAPTGVSPVLVRAVRAALDSAYLAWDVPADYADTARDFCRQVRIVVTGGFNRDRIARFEREGVPVDVYGVGSTFLRNDPATNTDYTMDVVRVHVGEQWVDMAKEGRKPNDNPDLQPVDLAAL